MRQHWKFVTFATATLATLATRSAQADWLTFNTTPQMSYCVDGADFTDTHATQHVAACGDDLFIGTCTETNSEDDTVDYLATTTNRLGITRTSFKGLGVTAEYLSTSSDFALWTVNKEDVISVSGALGWSSIQIPGGRHVLNVAASSGTHAFVLAEPAAGDNCPGGNCIWEIYLGSTPQIFGSDYDGNLGAIAVAYDGYTGKLWRLDDQSHVYSLETWAPAPGESFTYWSDHEPSGVPVLPKTALAVFDGMPLVIGAPTVVSGGTVFRQVTAGGTWAQQGTLANVTDIAIDPHAGTTWVVTYNGLEPGQGGGNNLWYWSPTTK
jgi:hypothetical protein